MRLLHLPLFAAIVTPIIVGFLLGIDLTYGNLPFTLTLFAFVSATHFIFQLLFGILNYLHNTKTIPKPTKTYSIQITGWKEDAPLFKRCLQSVKGQTYPPNSISFCSDGNEKEDEYMVNIFQEVFPECEVIRYATIPTTETVRTDHRPIFCVTQPHKGKRHAMHTQMLMHIHTNNDYIMFVDSDTILGPDSLEQLVQRAEYEDVDAITGDVTIYNKDNLLAFLVSLKYWYAFNVERSAQSYFRVVGCLSGPFSLYRTSCIRTIRSEWIQQKFLGTECTFGDDRHLTNLVLKQGGSTYYTPSALCYTDTPTTIRRFITQQTRWTKSFIREYLINFGWFKRKQLWLVYDMNFMQIYGLILSGYIIYLLTQLDFEVFMLFLMAVLGATALRALYATALSRNPDHVVFILYSYLYLLVIIPIKFWGLLTINNTSWGTGNRLIKTSAYIDTIPVVLWASGVISCVGISCRTITRNSVIYAGINAGATLFALLYYGIIARRRRNDVQTYLFEQTVV